MANRYAVTGQESAVTAALTTALDLVGATTTRPEIYFIHGAANTAATLSDTAVRVAVMRHTTANTGTAVVPALLDPSAPAAVATALENCSAEGTYTAATEMFDGSIHLRSQLYWYATDARANIIVPATANNGVGARVLHASFTGAYDFTFHFEGP